MSIEPGDNRPECCRKEGNLERFADTTNPLVYIMRCKECGRNHYHFMAPTIKVDLSAANK